MKLYIFFKDPYRCLTYGLLNLCLMLHTSRILYRLSIFFCSTSTMYCTNYSFQEFFIFKNVVSSVKTEFYGTLVLVIFTQKRLKSCKTSRVYKLIDTMAYEKINLILNLACIVNIVT